MTLRIIGGAFRSRLLKTPKGIKTRPTSAIMRKCVFDICQQHIQGKHVLDLFAGSGAMGLEALSRGAAHATFIDKDKQAIRTIEENIALLNVETSCCTYLGDAFSILKRKTIKHFDLVYIDPPYQDKGLSETDTCMYAELLEFFDQNPLLNENALVFVETSSFSKHIQTKALTHLALLNVRAFGKSLLHQYLYKR
jgi:16S rRNA (guanine966-N2)-methyltransferase